MIKSYWLYNRDDYTRPLPDFREQTVDDIPPPQLLPVTVGQSITEPSATRRAHFVHAEDNEDSKAAGASKDTKNGEKIPRMTFTADTDEHFPTDLDRPTGNDVTVIVPGDSGREINSGRQRRKHSKRRHGVVVDDSDSRRQDGDIENDRKHRRRHRSNNDEERSPGDEDQTRWTKEGEEVDDRPSDRRRHRRHRPSCRHHRRHRSADAADPDADIDESADGDDNEADRKHKPRHRRHYRHHRRHRSNDDDREQSVEKREESVENGDERKQRPHRHHHHHWHHRHRTVAAVHDNQEPASIGDNKNPMSPLDVGVCCSAGNDNEAFELDVEDGNADDHDAIGSAMMTTRNSDRRHVDGDGLLATKETGDAWTKTMTTEEMAKKSSLASLKNIV